MQGGAAGNQQVQAGTGSEQGSQGGRSSYHLLEVVQQQEQVAVTQSRLQLLEQGTIPSFPQSKRLGNGRDDTLRLAHGSQWYKADTVGEVSMQSGCGSQGEARFTHTSWTGEGQQAYLWTLQEGSDRLHLLLAPDQGSGWQWQMGKGELGGYALCGDWWMSGVATLLPCRLRLEVQTTPCTRGIHRKRTCSFRWPGELIMSCPRTLQYSRHCLEPLQ
jgi:hypothetical protein